MVTLLEKFKSLTRYWWAILILGIAIFAVGIVIFVRPAESFMSMGVVFAILMFVSGILELVVAFTEKYMWGRGWLAASGAIEVILGILLLVNPEFSAMMLPFILGFWLLFRGISLVGVAADMRALEISGMGWTIALAILLIICALVILFNPVRYGIAAVVVWVGIALLVAGISVAVFSFELLNIKKKYKKFKERIEG